MPDFRCSIAGEDAAEPIAGTAPTDTEWLFVEDAGPWAAKATGHLAGLVPGGRAQLIRRHGGASGPGVRVFRANLTAGLTGAPRVRTVLLDDVRELAEATADSDTWTPYDEPLWLVCTNGRRDVCCAERGRPVAATLASRWPEATWETTHLGGHRFAATLLALPYGVALGRLDRESAVSACAELLAGRVPLDAARGRAGWPPAAQWADLHMRAEAGWTKIDDVRLLAVDGLDVRLQTPDGERTITVETSPGPALRASCADDSAKATTRHRIAGTG